MGILMPLAGSTMWKATRTRLFATKKAGNTQWTSCSPNGCGEIHQLLFIVDAADGPILLCESQLLSSLFLEIHNLLKRSCRSVAKQVNRAALLASSRARSGHSSRRCSD